MADNSKIGWTDMTWNPVTGCSRVSPGCDNCYAMMQAYKMEHTDYGTTRRYDGTTHLRKESPDWTGVVNLHEDLLDVPIRKTRPRRIFVNSMSDLFHPSVPESFIDRVFDTMARASHHQFQVLTKRPQRMSEWIEKYMSRGSRPLSNVWLGTSVENDDVAFRRIYHLMKCKHWNTFLSMEPLLERVSLSFSYAKTWLDEDCNCHGRVDVLGDTPYGVDWVIVGGESGRNARPFRTEWARLLIVECRYAKTPIFIKQLGSNCIDVDGVTGKGTDPEQWPDDIRIQEFPER